MSLGKWKVYKITNLNTWKCYVGITTTTISERLRQHKTYAARFPNRSALNRAITKHGIAAFKIEQICSALSRDAMLELESYFIEQWRLRNPRVGYNQTAGGHHPTHSEQTKQRIGDKNRGKKWTSEQKMRLSEVRKGRKVSDETLQKMRDILLARNTSEEQRQKVSSALRGKKKERFSVEWCENLSKARRKRIASMDPGSHGCVVKQKKTVRGRDYVYWIVKIGFEGKMHIRCCKTPEQAEATRHALSIQLYGSSHLVVTGTRGDPDLGITSEIGRDPPLL